jgi:hypothetical protein
MEKNNFIKDNQNLIITGVVIFLSYKKIILPLMEKLGLTKSQAETNILEESTNPNSAWSPLYWKSAGSGALILTNNAADKFCDEIWNSVGYFSDDFEKVLGIFKQLKSKSQVSFLVDRFNQKYTKDLLVWLQGGSWIDWPADRFSSDQVGQLIDYVKNLRSA